ncbi:hypothetical protein MIZ03_1413 [Rhodoferax lithotrophicus]|uniref:Uncharacterized protein n=1 Tax=Rhodoferax lithotrophicus TaxID=2798804 RepID=A0ABM7MK19_9BURK|nr:hypothetical protein MIZ03_1413 [Rhodoferax sp. MIZ03]
MTTTDISTLRINGDRVWASLTDLDKQARCWKTTT